MHLIIIGAFNPLAPKTNISITMQVLVLRRILFMTKF